MQGVFSGLGPGFAQRAASGPFATNVVTQVESISAPLPMRSLSERDAYSSLPRQGFVSAGQGGGGRLPVPFT